jgi:hypothetical protein
LINRIFALAKHKQPEVAIAAIRELLNRGFCRAPQAITVRGEFDHFVMRVPTVASSGKEWLDRVQDDPSFDEHQESAAPDPEQPPPVPVPPPVRSFDLPPIPPLPQRNAPASPPARAPASGTRPPIRPGSFEDFARTPRPRPMRFDQ